MATFTSRRLALLVGFAANGLTHVAHAQAADEDISLIAPAAPQNGAPADSYVIALRDDGTATLRLQLKAGSAEQAVDLIFTQLTAGTAPALKTAFVGFRGDGTSAPLAHRQGVRVGANGVDLDLVTIGLERGVAYTGALSASLGRQKAIQWSLALTQPPLAPLIACPSEPLNVAADGSVDVTLPVAAFAAAESASARVGAFISATKETADVVFGATQRAPREVSGLAMQDGQLRFALRTAGMTEGSTYEGLLSLTLGQRAPQSCKLRLFVPIFSKGELVADPSAVTRQVNLPFFPWSNSSVSFRLRVWEKTGTKAVARIEHTLDGTSEAPGGTFDLERHATITYGADKRSWGDLSRGEKLDVDVTLDDVESGKYAFTLAFAGTGGAPPAKVPFTVNVRHHVAWAVIAVLASLVASYLLTKGIVYWRERIAIRQRIAQQKRVGLAEYDSLPSYTFWRAVLEQTERSIRGRWFLPPPASVKDYLDRAERVMKVLQKYAEVDGALKRIPADDDFMKHHYRNARDDVMSQVGITQPLDQATADKVIQDLAAIITRLEEPKQWYWAEIQRRAADLAARAALVKNQLAAGHHQADVDDIFAILVGNKKPTEPRAEYDFAFWRLHLLYLWRDSREKVRALHEAFNTHGMGAMFGKADELAWDRLTDAISQQTVSVAPADNLPSYEAMEPIKFVVRFDDPVLEHTYLVRHELDYEWFFENVPAGASPPSLGSQPRPTVTVKSPRVTRFALAPGTLTAKLVIRWRHATGKKAYEVGAPYKANITKNTELTLIRSLDFGEICVMIAVAALALITSLTALWHDKPAFGSFVDYVAILTWAFSLDQGKNLIQLQSVFQPGMTTSSRSS